MRFSSSRPQTVLGSFCVLTIGLIGSACGDSAHTSSTTSTSTGAGGAQTDGSDRAATIFKQLVTDPTKALDTSCKSNVLAPNFADDTNAFLFGTQTLWD